MSDDRLTRALASACDQTGHMDFLRVEAGIRGVFTANELRALCEAYAARMMPRSVLEEVRSLVASDVPASVVLRVIDARLGEPESAIVTGNCIAASLPEPPHD